MFETMHAGSSCFGCTGGSVDGFFWTMGVCLLFVLCLCMRACAGTWGRMGVVCVAGGQMLLQGYKECRLLKYAKQKWYISVLGPVSYTHLTLPTKRIV